MNNTDRVNKILEELKQKREHQKGELSLSANPDDWITANALDNVIMGIEDARQYLQKHLATQPTPESEGVEKIMTAIVYGQIPVSLDTTDAEKARDRLYGNLRKLVRQARQEEQVSMINRFESCMIDMDTENDTLIVDLDKYGPEFDEIKGRQLQGGSDE